jgi:phosphoribosylglycinamide formyltransferase-1
VIPVAILISGTGSNMETLARSMTGDHPGRPCLVLSNVAGAAGIARAADLGIPTGTVVSRGRSRQDFEAELERALVSAGARVICLAGFMRILSPGFIARWQGRVLNIHPSLLPKYPGLDTHRRALEAGDAETGCSVHLVTAELDAGPVLGQARVRVQPDDTPDSLARRVLAEEHRLYPAVLRRFLEAMGSSEIT